MIVYNHNTWLGSLNRIEGTVLGCVSLPLLCCGCWAAAVHVLSDRYPDTFEVSGDFTNTHKMLGGFVSFFLIFRTNQAYSRYWHCNETLKLVQIATRELHSQFIIYIKGGLAADGEPQKEYDFEQTAVKAKVDATRYIVAYCVAWKLHSRIAYDGYCGGVIDADKKEQVEFDRGRLRGLLTSEEFAIIDNMLLIGDEPCGEDAYPVSTEAACRACHVLVFFLRSLVGRVSVAAQKGWGWFERCMNLSDGFVTILMRAFEEMDQNVATPLPLPYCHLCKWLMGIYLSIYPIACGVPSQGLVVNVATTVAVALAMLGIEAISMEIEDPYGDDANDFDTMRIIGAIEDSLYEVLILKGGEEASYFTWVQAPEQYKQCDRFLSLRSEVRATVQRMPGAIIEKAHASQSPSRQALQAIGGIMPVETERNFSTAHDWVSLSAESRRIGLRADKPNHLGEVGSHLGLRSNGELRAWRSDWWFPGI